MNRKDIEDLRALVNALVGTFESWAAAVIPTLPPEGPQAATEAHVDEAGEVVLPQGQQTEKVKPQTIAPDAGMLDEAQNPWIKKDPAAWKGESMVGQRADECPLDYLEVYMASLVAFSQATAKKAQEKGDARAQTASDTAAAQARAIDAIIGRKRARSAGQKRTA